MKGVSGDPAFSQPATAMGATIRSPTAGPGVATPGPAVARIAAAAHTRGRGVLLVLGAESAPFAALTERSANPYSWGSPGPRPPRFSRVQTPRSTRTRI